MRSLNFRTDLDLFKSYILKFVYNFVLFNIYFTIPHILFNMMDQLIQSLHLYEPVAVGFTLYISWLDTYFIDKPFKTIIFSDMRGIGKRMVIAGFVSYIVFKLGWIRNIEALILYFIIIILLTVIKINFKVSVSYNKYE